MLCVYGGIMIGQIRHRFANQQGSFLAFVKKVKLFFHKICGLSDTLQKGENRKHVRGFGGENSRKETAWKT